MITLIGHGYVGEHIQRELAGRGLDYAWIRHNEAIPQGTKLIINAAGYTGLPNVDACEVYKQETIDGNVVFPLQLEISNPNIPIVHISSGCVYGGYKEGGWTEADEPNFTFNNGSFYSGSKSLEQQLLKPYMNKSYLLRIRMPFGDYDHPKNFLTKMKRYARLISYDNSLSYMPDVARFAVECVTQEIKPGIYNVSNPGYSNAREIVAMMGIEKEFFTDEEFQQAVVAPRSNCVLNTDKLEATTTMQNVQSALTHAIQKLNND